MNDTNNDNRHKTTLLSIGLSFKDSQLQALIEKACQTHFPDIRFDLNEPDLWLSDDHDYQESATPVIRFTSEAGSSTSIITLPFRLGDFLDLLKRRIYHHSSYNWRNKEIAVGPYTLRLRDGFLYEKQLYLTEKERDILFFLYKNNGQIVERKTLLNEIWEYADNVETHTLETHIYRLRQKIETNPAEPALLVTDGNGYRLS